MGGPSPSILWIILVFIHGCCGGLNMRLDLSWGYIHFNLTAGPDTERLQCDQDFSLLVDPNKQKQKDIRDTYGGFLKVLADKMPSDVCYSQAQKMVYQPKTTNCAVNFEIKEDGIRLKEGGNKLEWIPIKIANTDTSGQKSTNYCLVYDAKTQNMEEQWCSGSSIPGVACQRNPKQSSDNYYNMRRIIIIGSSIGLSSLVLQICILIGCLIHWCRGRGCCGGGSGGQREQRIKPSDAARCVRLQSLTSDGDSSAYDHVQRDPLSRSAHSLNHLHLQQQGQDGHLYNELSGVAAPDHCSPYSQPYTHFQPTLTQPRNPPPKGPPPVLPSGNEYAEPFPAGGRPLVV